MLPATMVQRGTQRYATAVNGATPVPADIVSRIINKQVTPLEDGFFYSRNLHGEQHIKMLVGMPKGYKPIPIDSELIAKLKDLAKQYS